MTTQGQTQDKPTPAVLFTDTISELKFRHLAGLCLRCGIARAEDSVMEICDGCENEQLARINRFISWRRRHRKAA